MSERPKMELLGMDGNIFAILGNASRLLKRNGQGDQAQEMSERVMNSESYESALRIISEYMETEISLPVKMKNGSKAKVKHSKDHR